MLARTTRRTLFFLLMTSLPVAAQEPASPPVDAEITIRKTVPLPGPRRERAGPTREGLASRKAKGGAPALSSKQAAAEARAGARSTAAVGGAVEALGETWARTGTLHLPGVGERGTTLDAAATPFVELEDGSRLIVDVGGRIPGRTAEAIEKRWPGNQVLTFPAGTHPRDVLSGVLSASGYAAVEPGAPIVFGREVRVRLRPDFVVIRKDDDLLDGLTRAISVVESPLDAFPGELRELAGEHRIAVSDVARDGSTPAEPWRDPVGGVTTIETTSRALILSEIADAAGVAAAVEDAGDDSPAGMRAAVRDILADGGATAIGPTVDFTRPTAAGGRSRFTISVPGWLVARGGRKLLVTGAALAEPLRLFLTREGIDVLEYRLRK